MKRNPNLFHCLKSLRLTLLWFKRHVITSRVFWAKLKQFLCTFYNSLEVNECNDSSHDCHPDAFCTDTDDSFNCTCKAGYTGDGRICVGLYSHRAKTSREWMDLFQMPLIILTFEIIMAWSSPLESFLFPMNCEKRLSFKRKNLAQRALDG